MFPSSPATRPAPKTMNTAIPFAIELRNTDPSSDTAATIATPPASSNPGVTMRSGHHDPS